MSNTKLIPAHLLNVSSDSFFDLGTKEFRKRMEHLFQLEMKLRSKKQPVLFGNSWICFHNNVPICIQDGPTCGLKALEMCAKYFQASVGLPAKKWNSSDLLQFAIEKGFTNEGEMFSANDLEQTVSSFFGFHTKLLDIASNSAKQILIELVHGHLTLIPYDNDKNNLPCLNEGKTAHWAVIVGFVIPVQNTDHPIILNDPIIAEEVNGNRLFLSSKTKENQDVLKVLEDSFTMNFEREDVFVLAQHSRSKHLQLWSYAQLLKSNQNLYAASQLRMSQQKWKIPEDLKELRGKAIVVIQPDAMS